MIANVLRLSVGAIIRIIIKPSVNVSRLSTEKRREENYFWNTLSWSLLLSLIMIFSYILLRVRLSLSVPVILFFSYFTDITADFQYSLGL